VRGSGISRAHPVKGTVGYALAKTCKAHRGNVGALLADLGLHVGQEMVLIELWEEDGLRGGELASRLGVEPPTVTKMLRRLEGLGLVRRRPDPADARSFGVYLTEKGRDLEGPVARRWERAQERTFAGLDPGERETLHRLLAKARLCADADASAN
jgi:MarR family transcriptional regulator, organic hydroperoxide resistance regulator